ncbi:hypothetical protein EUV02_06060 [Polymorphobacter arshaanensis]|uniref:Peptidyl-prolyl cis-trans isomerase, EpsD family n=1 Tax=Glacieibacterium arshaanense TaxID=2511025 RepID=A0A4Y9ETI4_9SPHN|nr:hypothetical protein [Polymorphobacter arshaanensis]TFU06539.1 hypothetical protein EUV02_06060 [Polymorphobacter arshaanensis]
MKQLSKSALIVGIALSALIAGCNKKDELPKGQVVATVDGTDITTTELNSEIALAQAPPEVPRKVIEQAALERIVERRMLADVATKRGLDKSPQYLMEKRRVDDGLLVQALQGSIASKVPTVTPEAAEKYIAAHPVQFADRKIYTIDQIQFLRPANIATIGLQEAKTMADVERVLTAANVEFRRLPATVDTMTAAPQLSNAISQILARNPSEVFMFADQPRGAPAPIVYINLVTNASAAPFTGPKAIAVAQPILQREAVQKALADELKKIKAEEKGKIVYAKGYEPAAAPAAGGLPTAGATPAAAAATKPTGAVPAANSAAATSAAPTAAPSN